MGNAHKGGGMMQNKTLPLTPAQQSAIEARGSALLVAAAAGSGKTKVLVERLLGYVTDKNEHCDITEFLIITYTRAAANELRSKILDEISQRLAREPDNRHLRRQAALCYEAHIGTIHGFCTDILRENAHLIDLPPDFRVADENESGIIRLSVLEELIEERYNTMDKTPGNSGGFASLVDAMSAGRDDKRLFDIVLDAHTKLLSHADPSRWVAEQLEILGTNSARDVSETVWGRYLMDEALRKSTYWRGVMQELFSGCERYPEFQKAYGGSLAATIDSLDCFIQALHNSWDDARSFAAINFFRPKNVPGFEELKEIRTRCREAMKKVASVFECTSEELLADMETVKPVVTELLHMVLDFDDAYGRAKKKRGIVDFSDLEHMTARLVADSETGTPTALAGAVSNRFKEIMVDEYQDCSGVQEVIFNAITKNGVNIFMVGDVKQSIYRFRLADPSIFLAKYKCYRDKPQDGEGRRILLSTNFRSRAGILSAVNFIFKNIMSEDFGEMEYTEREFLYPGREDDRFAEPAVELDILDMSANETEDDEESIEKTEAEAVFVAGRIEELINSNLCIPDGLGGLRPVSYGDFAILLRSVKGKAGVFARALADRHIPAGTADGEGFFESQEIAVMISLLEIIDNPRQDVPLIAVLRSPVYGFTPDELSNIRLTDNNAEFYTALLKAAETDDKCRAFTDELRTFRETAPDMTSDRLIWHVYNKTGMLGVIGALGGGETRRENLMKLLDLAVKFEQNGYKGLFGFINFIRKLIENGIEPGEKSETTTSNAVKIMSIHKSKGLEFPIVLLADTTKRFNNKDAVKPLLMHAQLGVGSKLTDLKRRIEYPTLARMAVARKLTREMTAEELRILYVAMTRAREKLIIISTFADADKEMARLQKDASAPVPPQILESARSMADFILLPALTRPEAGSIRQNGDCIRCDSDDTWDIRKTSADSKQGSKKNQENSETIRVKAEPKALEALGQKLGYRYPYSSAASIPSKLTATELKGRYTDLEAAEDADTPEYVKMQRPPTARPGFITERTALTPTERGTALHLAMQYIDYNKCCNISDIRQELQRLKEKSFLSAQQADAVDPEKIRAFFASPLGMRVLRADRLYREFKFSLLVRAEDYFSDGGNIEAAGDDDILFQGVIDCCFLENGVLHVIDFKSDYVTKETLAEKAGRYAPQLQAYGRAMERITGLPVKSRIIYFFALDEVSIVG
jgi:ATP-dependent helicase/nuclease subunit A